MYVSLIPLSPIVNYFLIFLSDFLYPLKLSNPLSKSIVLKYWVYIIKLPMSFFETRKTGEITSKFSNANTLIEVLGGNLNSSSVLIHKKERFSLKRAFRSTFHAETQKCQEDNGEILQ
ncbi:ABC transporter transmembrane domain-containing protein [Ligilactobacillus ruminis]|uniref:ABC transporter transmembrane domain-containing protein n=1 Tax=Ligilactobacillus ruminis TaxID=1623 RepID=UPI002FD83361